jgi:Icc-related predicted phosphoesterase
VGFLRRRDPTVGSGTATSIFYSSDLHGSDRCWRKFLGAANFYQADTLIMGGDLTGKAVVPISHEADGSYTTRFLGEQRRVSSDEQLSQLKDAVRFNGMYPWVASPGEVQLHRDDDAARDLLFETVMLDELGRWLALADKKAEVSGVDIFAIAGNDDPWVCDTALAASKRLRPCEDRLVDVGGHEMISCSMVNPTPWDSPREMAESELYGHLHGLAEQVSDPSRAIFMFHAPPYDSGLDIAREINPEDLTVVMRNGQPHEIPVGSKAVRQIIEEYQPLLSLHGHIHESRGITTIGRTTCINPGSDYASGQIHGAVVKLSDHKLTMRQLVIG